jgi:hypothetical protein
MSSCWPGYQSASLDLKMPQYIWCVVAEDHVYVGLGGVLLELGEGADAKYPQRQARFSAIIDYFWTYH